MPNVQILMQKIRHIFLTKFYPQFLCSISELDCYQYFTSAGSNIELGIQPCAQLSPEFQHSIKNTGRLWEFCLSFHQ